MEMSYFVRFPLLAGLTPAAAILWMNSTPAFWRRLSRSKKPMSVGDFTDRMSSRARVRNGTMPPSGRISLSVARQQKWRRGEHRGAIFGSWWASDQSLEVQIRTD